MGHTNSRDQTIENVDPPSGSPAGSPVMMRVVREEIPLSKREGEEVMKRRLSVESRSPPPPPFEPSSSTAIAAETDAETATAAASTEEPNSKPPNRFLSVSRVSLLDMDMYLLLSMYSVI